MVKVNGKVARYPIASASKGKKKAFWMHFPAELEIKPMNVSYHVAREKLNLGRVSANSIRKWNYNFLILNEVPESVADFIQGRASVTVGSSHYLEKTRQAIE